MIESIVRDVRQALRFLVRRPGFALAAVTTIAIGIGTITVAFTAVNSVLYRGLLRVQGVPGGGRVYVDERGQNEGEASFLEYQSFAKDVPSLDIAASSVVTLGLRQPDGAADLVYGLAVTRNHFQLLGIEAAAGRTFGQDDDGLSVIVSDRFWRERLNSASLTGLAINLNGLDVPVMGVLPEDARDGIYDPSLWVRIDDWDALRLPAGGRGAAFNVFGRLRAGATRAQANRELEAVSTELARAWPETNARRNASFRVFGDSTELRALRRAAATAMAMIGVVLLIALFNLVGLLLARGVDREREMSLRGALGAGRSRLVRQLVTESLVIAALGGAVALLVARFSNLLLRSFAIQAPMPQRIELAVDWRVTLFTAALVVGCGLIAGLVPARQATRLGVAAVLSPAGVIGGSRQTRLRALVVGLQLAGATMLLAIAGLLVRNAVLASAADVGFERERALLVWLFPANHGYTPESAQRLVAGVVERVRSTPGVVAAAAADRVPFYIGFRWRMTASAGGTCAPPDCPEVAGYRVGSGYFRAMNIALRRGREFDGSAADTQSAVISETLAGQFWPSRDPLGQSLTLGTGRRVQVIGVAANVVHRGLGERPEPYIYLPLDADAFAAPVTVVVRTASNPAPLLPVVEAHIRAADRALPLMGLKTMAQHLDERARAGGRIVARFFLVCGGLGLFLALVGLAGSVSYSVRQRTRELGVRAAIGATPGDLGRLVIGSALRMSAAGIAIGLVAAFGLARILGSRLSGLDLDSPWMIALVGMALVAMAAGAAAVPALRASRTAPLAALRSE
jgi:putative ABC transport system permease protein